MWNDRREFCNIKNVFKTRTKYLVTRNSEGEIRWKLTGCDASQPVKFEQSTPDSPKPHLWRLEHHTGLGQKINVFPRCARFQLVKYLNIFISLKQ